jgi:hypothetical protein
MRRQFSSFGALLVMIVLAFGSADTASVQTGGERANPRVERRSSSADKTDENSLDHTPSETAVAPTPPRSHKMNETVHIGYTTYAVWNARWSDQLSDNQFLDQPPNAKYLFVQLTVRNNDNKARSIPPFELIDSSGAEYEASPHGWAVEGSIGLFDSLNPGVSKQGFVVFDVTQGNKYHLKVSGGYWSGEDTLIEIVDPEEQHRQREIEASEERVRLDAERVAAQQAREFEIDTAKWRYWSSSSGKHKTHAKFIKMANELVTLENKNGKRTEIPIEKLSKDDQDFIKNREWLKPIAETINDAR